MLTDIEGLLLFLEQQSVFYQGKTKDVSYLMSYHLNVSIILSLLFIGVFWVFGIRYNYQRILDECLVTHEMYNIIGYNLQKEMEKIN